MMRSPPFIRHQHEITALAVSDGRLYSAAVGEPVRVSQTDDGSLIGHIAGPATDIAIWGTRLAVAAQGTGIVTLWDTRSREPARLSLPRAGVVHLVVRGDRLYTGEYRGEICRWNDELGQEGEVGLRKNLNAFDTDGELACGAYSAGPRKAGPVRLWRWSTNKAVRVKLEGHSLPITAVCLSKDALFTASRDGTIRVYERPDFTLSRVLQQPDADAVVALAVSGEYVYAAGAHTLRVWSQSSGALVAETNTGDGSCHAIAVDGFDIYLASGSEVQHWRLNDRTTLVNPQASGVMEPVEFMEAVTEGRTEDALAGLAAGADPNGFVKGFGQPLWAAAGAGHGSIIGPLLAAGATGGARALLRAARSDHADVVRALVAGGVSPNGEEGADQVPLVSACAESAFEAARALVECGADPNRRAERDSSALFCAVGGPEDRPDIVQLLLDAGAEVDPVDSISGNTPFMWALFTGNGAMATVLLEAGADMKVRSKGRGTALQMAALRGMTEVVKRLLTAGVKVDLKNSDGATALLSAVPAGHTDVVSLLVNAGADKTIQNKGGYDALALATLYQHTEIIALLTGSVGPQEREASQTDPLGVTELPWDIEARQLPEKNPVFAGAGTFRFRCAHRGDRIHITIPGKHFGPDTIDPTFPEQRRWMNTGVRAELLRPYWDCAWDAINAKAFEAFVAHLRPHMTAKSAADQHTLEELRRNSGKPKRVIAEATRLLAASPAWGEVALIRGKARERSNDLEGARADYELALEIYPDNVEAQLAADSLPIIAPSSGEEAVEPEGMGAPSLEVRSVQVFGDEDGDRAVRLNPKLSESIARQGAQQIRSVGARHGNRVVVGGGAHQALVFDLDTGALSASMGPFLTKYVRVHDVSSDGKRALVGSEQNELAVFDLETGERLRRLSDDQSAMAGLFFARDGWVVSGTLGADGLRFWDLEAAGYDVQGDVRQPLHMLPLTDSTVLVTFHRVNTTTYKLEASYVEAWDVSTRKRLWSAPIEATGEPEKIRSVDANADGSIVAVGGALGHVHLLVGGQATVAIPRSEQCVRVVRFRRSTERNELLVLTGDWVLRCFDVSKPSSPKVLFEHTLESHGCAGSTWEREGYVQLAGDRLAFRDPKSHVHVCDVVSGEELGAFSCADFTGLRLWEDGRLLTQTKTGRIDFVELAGVPSLAWESPTLAGAPTPTALPVGTAMGVPAPKAAPPSAEPTKPVPQSVAIAADPAKLAALQAVAVDSKATKTARLEASIAVLQIELAAHLQAGTLGSPQLVERALEAVETTRKRHKGLLWDLANPLFRYLDVHDLRDDAVTAFLCFISKEKPKYAWAGQAVHRIPRFVTDPRVQSLLAQKLPKAAAAHQDAMNATIRARYGWSGRRSEPVPRTSACVGGSPALPQGTSWPRDRAGKPMHFLAQFSCDLVPMEGWPQQGMLLFFAANDAVLSLVGECAVLHVDAVPVEAMADVSLELGELGERKTFEYPPVETPGGVNLHADVQPMSMGDYRFDTTAPGFSPRAKLSWHKKSFYTPSLSQLGGYPYFTQEDTRRPTDVPNTDVMLLQLDSDPAFGMQWGDNGLVHFFISSADLEVGDFSRVRFSGDCY